MKKRIMILSLIAVILLGITTPVVADGPPFPAVAFMEEDGCVMPWLQYDQQGEITVLYIYGTIHVEYQPQNGVWNTTCRFKVNFNDPSNLSIQDVCALGDFPCSQGTFIANGWDCEGPEGLMTTDTHWVVPPSGNAMATCRFNPNKP
jgi:hypothetical protein